MTKTKPTTFEEVQTLVRGMCSLYPQPMTDDQVDLVSGELMKILGSAITLNGSPYLVRFKSKGKIDFRPITILNDLPHSHIPAR